VLDALLEDGRLAVDATTGASAGAMNAVVMVQGWLEGGIDRGRAASSKPSGAGPASSRPFPPPSVGFSAGCSASGATRPGQAPSPKASVPTRRTRSTSILCGTPSTRSSTSIACACTDVEIFFSATNVWTGKVAIFKTQELTADHLMASACLPTVFQAVEIDGVPHWDGGYMGNPALFPLYYETMTDDILLVQVNPLARRQTPRTAREIHDRLNEITFNGNLLRELLAVAFVKRLI
jgi:NTE family protein